MAFKRRGVFGFRAARHIINREGESAECLTSLLPVPFPHTLVSSCHISCVAEGKTRWFPSRMWAKGKKLSLGQSEQGRVVALMVMSSDHRLWSLD